MPADLIDSCRDAHTPRPSVHYACPDESASRSLAVTCSSAAAPSPRRAAGSTSWFIPGLQAGSCESVEARVQFDRFPFVQFDHGGTLDALFFESNLREQTWRGSWGHEIGRLRRRPVRVGRADAMAGRPCPTTLARYQLLLLQSLPCLRLLDHVCLCLDHLLQGRRLRLEQIAVARERSLGLDHLGPLELHNRARRGRQQWTRSEPAGTPAAAGSAVPYIREEPAVGLIAFSHQLGQLFVLLLHILQSLPNAFELLQQRHFL